MKLTFFLAFFSLGLALMAQESAVVLSDKVSSKGFFKILIKDEQGCLILRDDGKYSTNKYTLLRYNNRFILEWKLKIANRYKDLKVQTERVLYINNKIIVLQTHRNKKQKEVTLYMKEIDRFGKVLSEKVAAKRHTKNGYLPYELSSFSNYILVKDNHYEEYTDTIEKKEYSLFNAEGELLWNRTMVFPHSKGLFQYFSEEIDSHGNLFILTRSNFTLTKLFAYLRHEDIQKEMVIDTGSHYFFNLRLKFSEQGIYLLGLCRNDNRLKTGLADAEFNTIYTANMSNKDLSINYSKFTPITPTIDKEYKSFDRRTFDKGYNVEIKNMIYDGNLFVLTEFSKIMVSKNFVDGRTVTTTSSGRDNIMIFKLNENGELVWQKEIEKHQASPDDKMLSFVVLHNENKLLLAYNQPKLNLALVSVDKENGSFSQERFFTSEEFKRLALIEWESHYVSDTALLLMLSVNNNMNRLAFWNPLKKK